MAKASAQVINALRNTAQVLEKSETYQWGHMGACNCGFLAQEVTTFRKDEIHDRAMQRHGDWREQLNDYCPTSGLPFDELISELLAFGFDAEDLQHLERLSDSTVLRALPVEQRNLKQNIKKDVVLYLYTWADLLEQQFLDKIRLPQFTQTTTIL